MSNRYSVREVEAIVKHIELDAKEAGLIPAAAFMSYHPGNAGQGIAGYVDCIVQHEDGQYESVRTDFIPKFPYHMTKTDHARLLNAVRDVFYAFRRNREEAEQEENRRKMNYLSEHVARRSE
jgi:hypothetical protein